MKMTIVDKITEFDTHQIIEAISQRLLEGQKYRDIREMILEDLRYWDKKDQKAVLDYCRKNFK